MSKSNLDLNENVRSCHAKVSESHLEAPENEVIQEFEKDEMSILSLKEKAGCGLDLTILVSVKSFNECEFETHSEGRLRKHKRAMHQTKESTQI